MNIFIRTDASASIGTGHVIRCLTLADELRRKGAEASFICRKETGNLIGFIEEKGYRVYPLPADIDFVAGMDMTQRILKEQQKPADWLIVDHYEIDVSWEYSFRKFANKIMVIDDIANRKHDCDILLDQNYSGNRKRYNGLVPENCIQLLGPEYALLRPQFREARENLRERNGGVEKILVFMGGADPTNETGKALKALNLLNRDDIAVAVVIGASNPFKNELEILTKRMPNTACYFNVDNMAELMANADISIGASGSSTWERCCIGLPSIVMILADNQKEIAEELEREDVVVNLGWHEDVKERNIRNAVENLLTDSDKRKKMRSKGKALVDGRGVERTIERICATVEEDK
ncbi:MAG: UDP-2,4-diacetamido-2,4,6-trideoxy-beta-L-altropyranose hydrolase [Deltaproteobacteria bacterium]|nr:UDP-2,4-diacetamido-2,4,6-trideoxy-beta-L-altropyranose hydrolase [Deltaproteobacteria bacterium]